VSTESGDNRAGILRTIPQELEYPDPRTLPAQPLMATTEATAHSLRINSRKVCRFDGQDSIFENI
jgi:hypothetical protein